MGDMKDKYENAKNAMANKYEEAKESMQAKAEEMNKDDSAEDKSNEEGNGGMMPEGSSAISTHYVEEYPSNMGPTGLPPADDNNEENESK